MKSIPASSARRASARQSGQLADQRSGTVVAVREDEQFAPNTPIFSVLALCIATRSRIDPARVEGPFISSRPAGSLALLRGQAGCLDDLGPFCHLGTVEGIELLGRADQGVKALGRERGLQI